MKNFIFYRGPSMIDGAPIVGIATIKSRNGKNGRMVQTWIMRSDVGPVSAARAGLDESICGQCPHRGKFEKTRRGKLRRIKGTRACYVNLGNAPTGIFKTFAAGKYDDRSADLSSAAAAVAGLLVRLGAYGDPAAIPFEVWERLLSLAAGHTGYTHQWRSFPRFKKWCMASADSASDRLLAKALGWRTFRVSNPRTYDKAPGEVLCGASKEAGKKTTCAACMACGGISARAKADIVIPGHGGGRLQIAA